MQFLNANYTRESLKLALPVVVTQVGQASVNLFDTMMVGKMLGADAMTSVSLGNSVFFIFFVLALGFSLAIPPLVSEAQAQENHDRINSVFRHGFVINLIAGIILTIIIFSIRPLLYHLGQDPAIIPDTISYLGISAFTIVPFMMFQTLRETSEGLSYTIGVTKATIVGNILNIALNYVLIKGVWIFPEMGVRGSATATLIARIFMMFFLLYILSKHSTTKRYIKDFSIKANLFKKEMFRQMLKLGLPTSLQMFFEVSAFAAAPFICGLVSKSESAGHQIVMSMASFTFNLCIGLSVASTIMVGKRMGTKDFVSAKEIGINNLKMVFIVMSLCCAAFIIGKDTLPNLFVIENQDAEVLKLASSLMVIASLFQLSDGTQIVSLGALRGFQDVKVPSIITLIAYWGVTIPLGSYLCVGLGMGAYGMWVGFGVGLTISSILLISRFLKKSNDKIRTQNAG